MGLNGTDFFFVTSDSSVSLLFRLRMTALGSGRGVDPTSLLLRVTRLPWVSSAVCNGSLVGFFENKLNIDGLLVFDLAEASLELRPTGLSGAFFLRFGRELNRSAGRSIYLKKKITKIQLNIGFKI